MQEILCRRPHARCLMQESNSIGRMQPAGGLMQEILFRRPRARGLMQESNSIGRMQEA